MVFVHGGGFVSGSGSDPLYDGSQLAKATGNLVVTLNYRLGALGFLSMAPPGGEQQGSAGNYGILDQIAALQWVHDNITTFGGDPSKVTLFGESAGGTSMFIHLASPQSRGLFSRMIIESAAMGPYDFPGTLSQSTADALGSSFAISAGCMDSTLALSCLRQTPVDTILNATPANGPPAANQAYWLPVIDGYVIPTDPIEAIVSGSFTKVPTLIGNNRNEGTLLLYDVHDLPTDEASYMAFEEAQAPGHGADIVLRYPITSYSGSYFYAASAALTDGMFVCPARRVARAIAASGTPTFRYDFTHVVPRPEKDLGAFHTSELPFVFDNEFCWFGPCVSLQPAEVPLSRAIMGYWGRMARTGDPNGAGAFEWPKYELTTEPEIVLDVVPTTESDLERSQCDFWDTLGR
jgi:para-nitrobenzyl esterase